MASERMLTTELVVNARLELLRGLAAWRDFREKHVCDGKWEADFLRLVPLNEASNDFVNEHADILLAVRECAAVNEIEHQPPTDAIGRLIYPDGFVAITDLGYDRIRAHDALGEIAQESAHAD